MNLLPYFDSVVAQSLDWQELPPGHNHHFNLINFQQNSRVGRACHYNMLWNNRTSCFWVSRKTQHSQKLCWCYVSEGARSACLLPYSSQTSKYVSESCSSPSPFPFSTLKPKYKQNELFLIKTQQMVLLDLDVVCYASSELNLLFLYYMYGKRE